MRRRIGDDRGSSDLPGLPPAPAVGASCEAARLRSSFTGVIPFVGSSTSRCSEQAQRPGRSLRRLTPKPKQAGDPQAAQGLCPLERMVGSAGATGVDGSRDLGRRTAFASRIAEPADVSDHRHGAVATVRLASQDGLPRVRSRAFGMATCCTGTREQARGSAP